MGPAVELAFGKRWIGEERTPGMYDCCCFEGMQVSVEGSGRNLNAQKPQDEYCLK